MSMPPTAMRLMRWHNRHRILADSVLAALVLGLDTLLGLVPALTEGPSPAASWLPTTVAAVVLCTGALSLRRVRPVTAWATTVVVPMLHDVVIYSVYGFRSDAFAIVANSLSAYGLIGTPHGKPHSGPDSPGRLTEKRSLVGPRLAECAFP